MLWKEIIIVKINEEVTRTTFIHKNDNVNKNSGANQITRISARDGPRRTGGDCTMEINLKMIKLKSE